MAPGEDGMYTLYWGRRTGAFAVDAALAEAGVEP